MTGDLLHISMKHVKLGSCHHSFQNSLNNECKILLLTAVLFFKVILHKSSTTACSDQCNDELVYMIAL